jgi:hypothetical protein
MPLEREDGEYAYTGQLILQGIPPYKIAYNMKLPGTYVGYAAILRTFGETAAGVHLGLLLVNGCTTVLMFFLGRQLYGDLAGETVAESPASSGCIVMVWIELSLKRPAVRIKRISNYPEQVS